MTVDLLQKEEAEVGIVSRHRRVGLAGGKVGIPLVQIVRRSVQGRSVGQGRLKLWREAFLCVVILHKAFSKGPPKFKCAGRRPSERGAGMRHEPHDQITSSIYVQ